MTAVTYQHTGYSTFHVFDSGIYVGIVQKQAQSDVWFATSPSIGVPCASREDAAALLLAVYATAHRIETDKVLATIRENQVIFRQGTLLTWSELVQGLRLLAVECVLRLKQRRPGLFDSEVAECTEQLTKAIDRVDDYA